MYTVLRADISKKMILVTLMESIMNKATLTNAHSI